jgi:hypothetical protein
VIRIATWQSLPFACSLNMQRGDFEAERSHAEKEGVLWRGVWCELDLGSLSNVWVFWLDLASPVTTNCTRNGSKRTCSL